MIRNLMQCSLPLMQGARIAAGQRRMVIADGANKRTPVVSGCCEITGGCIMLTLAVSKGGR
jgi:hypothetical protein